MEQNDEEKARSIHTNLETTGAEIGERTICRGRSQLGWTYKATKYCQLIRANNLPKRLEWGTRAMRAMQQGFRFDNWIFTDETTVLLEWAKSKSFYRKGATVKGKLKPKHPLKVHAWGGISRCGRTRLFLFTGIIDAEFYTQIMEAALIPSGNELYGHGNYILIQDNDPKHASRLAKDFFERHGVRWEKTPAESPDINPIELIWADLKRYIRGTVKPMNMAELRQGILNYWETLTVAKCNKYIDHLRKVVPEVVKQGGAATMY